MMTALNDQALRVLDLSHELDVPLLDQIVTCFYGSVGPEVVGVCVCMCCSCAIHTIAEILYTGCSFS